MKTEPKGEPRKTTTHAVALEVLRQVGLQVRRIPYRTVRGEEILKRSDVRGLISAMEADVRRQQGQANNVVPPGG